MQLSADDPAQVPKEFLKTAGRFYAKLDSTPDHRLLVAESRQSGSRDQTVLIDPRTKSVVITLDASAWAWISSQRLVGFDWIDPTQLIELDRSKKIPSVKKLGRMLDSYVIDLDLLTDGKRAVVGVLSIPKTLEDRYKQLVRVSFLDLSNGSQKKLFEVAPSQGRVSVIDDSAMYPSFDRIKLMSLESNQLVREFIVKKSILKTALSANQKWLGVFDDGQRLTVFDVSTAKQVSEMVTSGTDEIEFMVITNDGRYIHSIDQRGQLITFDVPKGIRTEIVLRSVQERHSRIDFITLANDDKWLITAGNHGDIGIFERATGNLVCYEQSSAASSYVEKVWVNGDRLIFTTDTGVMLDGRLVKTPPGQHPENSP